MNRFAKGVSLVAAGIALAGSHAISAPKADGKNWKVVVFDRSANNFLGSVLESRYVGRRNDPVKVAYAGTEKLNLTNGFTLEAVLHTTEKGSYVWKEGKYNDKPVSYKKENPILTRGSQCGITIKENKIIFYLATEKGTEKVSMDIPKNWHRPVTSHRLNATYSGSEMKLFLDGKQVVAKSVNSKIKPAKTTVYAGGRADKPAVSATQIQVDDVRIYKRVLSTDEIANPLRRSQKDAILSSDIITTTLLKRSK